MSVKSLTAKDDLAPQDSETKATTQSQAETVVPLSRLVEKVSQRDDSFLNRVTLQLLELFAAGKPTPGAGSAAALIGALAGSLTQSVARYTIKAAKKRAEYTPFSERAVILLEEAREKSYFLRGAVDEDSTAYGQYRHWRLQFQEAHLAGASEAEKAKLQARTNEALRHATEVPIQAAEYCIAIAEISLELYDSGYKDARGETSTAILCAIATGEAAVHTARLNLQSAGITNWVDGKADKIRSLRRRLRGLRRLIEVRIYEEEELS